MDEAEIRALEALTARVTMLERQHLQLQQQTVKLAEKLAETIRLVEEAVLQRRI